MTSVNLGGVSASRGHHQIDASPALLHPRGSSIVATTLDPPILLDQNSAWWGGNELMLPIRALVRIAVEDADFVNGSYILQFLCANNLQMTDALVVDQVTILALGDYTLNADRDFLRMLIPAPTSIYVATKCILAGASPRFGFEAQLAGPTTG